MNKEKIDNLTAMVGDAIKGDATELLDELEAMRSMLVTWSQDAADENDYRLANIAACVSELAAIVAMGFELRNLLRGDDI